MFYAAVCLYDVHRDNFYFYLNSKENVFVLITGCFYKKIRWLWTGILMGCLCGERKR